MSQEEKNGYNFDSDPNIPICRYFKRGCMRGDSCKFRHVLEQNNGYNKNNHNNNKEENKFNKQENKAENIYENEGMFVIIRKKDFGHNNVEPLVHSIISNMKITKLPFFVFDIHNTTEYTAKNTNKQQLDLNVFEYVEKLNENNYSVLFLSYDGHEDRIQTNRNFLNKSSDMLLKMDKLFIKKREKGLILHIIRE
eukprot:75831_1